MLNFQGVFIDSGRRFGRFFIYNKDWDVSIYWDENLLILVEGFWESSELTSIGLFFIVEDFSGPRFWELIFFWFDLVGG